MITVCLNEANFEYDIHSLVKAFYAKEDVKVFADRERICWLEREVTPLFHMEIAFRQPGEQGNRRGEGKGKDVQSKKVRRHTGIERGKWLSGIAVRDKRAG